MGGAAGREEGAWRRPAGRKAQRRLAGGWAEAAGRVAGRRALRGGRAEDGRRRPTESPGGGRGRRAHGAAAGSTLGFTVGQQGKDHLDPFFSRVDPLRTMGRI
jgi:hypothetical protein